MEEIFTTQFVTTVGFPAAICIYTLFGVNQTLKDLTGAINKLTNDVDKRGEKQSQEISNLRDELKEVKYQLNKLQVKYSDRE
jgi:hypothetical protein